MHRRRPRPHLAPGWTSPWPQRGPSVATNARQTRRPWGLVASSYPERPRVIAHGRASAASPRANQGITAAPEWLPGGTTYKMGVAALLTKPTPAAMSHG